MKKKSGYFSKSKRREILTGYGFLLPNFIGFLLFTWIPIIMCFCLSLTDYDGFRKANFIGLQNFSRLWQDGYFTISLKNNLVFTGLYVPMTLLFALLLAVLVNSIVKARTFFRTALIFPHIVSYVSVAIIWAMMFHPQEGIINKILMSLGINNPPGWLVSSKWALIAIVIVMVWKSCGYYMILLFAGLQAIPQQYQEAAEIDGAGKINKFFYITLPLLSPTILFVIITLMITSFQVFDVVNVMTEGGPGRSSNVLVYRIYEEAYKYYKFGYASSISVILFMITLIITLLLLISEKKWVTYLQ